MAGSQDNEDRSYDPMFGEDFDVEGYCAEVSAQLESAPGAEPPAPGLSSRTTRLYPREDQEYPTDATYDSLENRAPFGEDCFDVSGGSSQAATETGNEPLLQLDPPLGNSNSIAEIQDIDDELEEVELMLKHKELRKKRRRIIQNMPLLQQAQSSQRLESRDDRTSCKPSVGAVSIPEQTEPFLNASQEPIQASLPTESAQASTYPLAQTQDGTTNSLAGFMDTPYAGSDNQYSVDPTNPSYLNPLALPNSAPEVLFNLGVIEQPGVTFKDTSGPLVNDIMDLPNNVLAGAYDSETINHFGVQNSMPNPVSGQPPIVPALSGSLHGQFPDPAGSAPTSSALHNHQPNQTPVMGKAPTRKRRRSPQGASEQRMSATRKQVSKQSRVPENHLIIWCSEPAPKNIRTTSQKQNKKAVEKAGGSCFLCLVLKKQCSGHRPCDRCKSFWQERALGSTSFMWTCDVRSKLIELYTFKDPLGINLPPKLYNAWANNVLEDISDAKIKEDVYTQLASPYAIRYKFGYLFDLVDSLEPARERGALGEFSSTPLTDTMYLYSYAHSVVRSKELLLCIAPRLKHDIASIERLYRESCLRILKYCDVAHTSTEMLWAMLILWHVYDELHFAGKSKELDPPLAEHLQSNVLMRLAVYSTRISDPYFSKRFSSVMRGPLLLAKQVPYLVPGSPLPRVRQGVISRNRVQPTLEAESLRFPSCLLSCSDVNERQPLVTPTNWCCCGWIINCIPSGILKFFGHSSDSFAHRLHKEWFESSAGKPVSVNAGAHFNTFFGQPNIEIPRLQKRMAIFRELILFSLQHNLLKTKIIASKITQTGVPIDQADNRLELLLHMVLSYAAAMAAGTKDLP